MDKKSLRDSTGITKETTLARKLLSDYTTICSSLGSSTTVTLAEVLSPDSEFWQNDLPSKEISCDISWSVKKDTIQAYLLIKRSEEELLLLLEEKQNSLAYWSDKRK